MGAVSTERVILGPTRYENHGQPGVFGVTSRDATQPIIVSYGGAVSQEIVELRRAGDSMSMPLVNIDYIDITASTYPTTCLVLMSNTPGLTLATAPYVSAVSGGLIPWHADIEVAAGAGGSSVIATPAAGTRFIVASVYVASDSQMRVAVVDNTDAAGYRILAHPSLPAGGAIARFLGDPDGYIQASTAQALHLVYGGAGNIYAMIDGYVRQG